jgi:hypothetical protein
MHGLLKKKVSRTKSGYTLVAQKKYRLCDEKYAELTEREARAGTV